MGRTRMILPKIGRTGIVRMADEDLAKMDLADMDLAEMGRADKDLADLADMDLADNERFSTVEAVRAILIDEGTQTST